MKSEMNTSATNLATVQPPSPWLTVKEAADRARCGTRTIYSAVQSGKLRAAHLGGRRELRFLAEWVDEFLLVTSTPVMVSPSGSRTNAPDHQS